MIKEASAMKVRQNLGDLLNEVQYRKGKILITKAGKPVAALVDIALFERIQRLDREFEGLAKALADAFQDVPSEKGMKWVDEAMHEARTKVANK